MIRRALWSLILLITGICLLLLGLDSTGTLHSSVVLTGSMTPAAPVGSVLLSRPTSPTALRVGDVVVLRAPAPWNKVVAHRIVTLEDKDGTVVLTTKGDANRSVDPWHARLDNGDPQRVALVVPWLGHALIGVHALESSRLPRALVLVLAAWLIALTWRRPHVATASEPLGFDLSHLPAR